MQIEMIDKQEHIFQIGNRIFRFVKPYYLMPDIDMKLIKGKVKGSTLGWNVCGEWISYNALKNAATNARMKND